MKKVGTVDRELIPDCCISCSELIIDGSTLMCNCDGCDVLPFHKCEEYKRLKYYGQYHTRLDIAI